MNKLVRNTLVLLFSTICSLSNSSSVNNKKANLNLIDCGSCVHDESEIHHEHDSLEIINLPTTLSFGVNTLSTDDNYGTYKVQANYQPVGCLTDTIWTSSNSDVIRIDVDFSDSSIATLVCLQPFEGEITITATSKYFSDISFSCSATYKQSFQITPLKSTISLTGSRYRSCPGVSYTFSYDNKILLTSLYSINQDVNVKYEVSGSGIIIDGNYIRMSSAINSSLGKLKIIPEGYEDQAITINVDTSYTSSSGDHNYVRSTLKSAYDGPTQYGSWSSWETLSEATCLVSGKRQRTRSRYYYHYTTKYEFECSKCGDSYTSGGSSSKVTMDDEVDTETIPALGHSNDGKMYHSRCARELTFNRGTQEYDCLFCKTNSVPTSEYRRKCSRCGSYYKG